MSADGFCGRANPMDDVPTRLLAPDEPQPVTATNEGGRSAFIIVADHAGNYLPRRLRSLGLGPAELERHIAWDIGVGAVCGPSRPAIGPRVPIGVESPYVVLYEHDPPQDTVTIFRVVHGRRKITGKMLLTDTTD
jgi:ParE toxin of type II toxin-antitoxin system, parDE